MTDATPRWMLPMLYAGQAQKELFHNEALARIDMLLHGVVSSADLTEPPASPDAGESWIVASGGTDAWEGYDDAIACWTESGWRFVAPRQGLRVHALDRGHALAYDGVEWRDAALRTDGLYIDGEKVIGARQDPIAAPTGGAVIDAEVRVTVAAILNCLATHGLIDS